MPHTSAKPAPVPTVTDAMLAEHLRLNLILLEKLRGKGCR